MPCVWQVYEEKEVMLKFEFNKDECEYLIDKLMLKEEYAQILKLRVMGYSIVEISMKLNLSERTINRRIKELNNKIKRGI